MQSHTILGSKTQRGVTQLSMELLFRTIDSQTIRASQSPSLIASLISVDASEAQIVSAAGYLDSVFGDGISSSRAATPMTVGKNNNVSSYLQQKYFGDLWNQSSLFASNHAILPTEKATLAPKSIKKNAERIRTSEKEREATDITLLADLPSSLAFWRPERITRTKAKLRFGNILQDSNWTPSTPRRNLPQRPTALPRLPDISDIVVSSSKNMEYSVLVSMYEVYNDRIFDLLTHPRNAKDIRRRPLLFKSTERSPDRKIVAGLRKVVCGSYEEALMVLETGLMERRVAGTGSNSVSSRSHGFFCLEVKRRPRGGMAGAWSSSQLTIVDLAGKFSPNTRKVLSNQAYTQISRLRESSKCQNGWCDSCRGRQNQRKLDVSRTMFANAVRRGRQQQGEFSFESVAETAS